MELTPHQTGVVDINSDQLRELARKHGESEYLLIDVRQPEEYQQAHVPGAKLLPMMEVQSRSAELEQAPERLKIFICRSGNRSGRVAQFAARALGLPNVFNLRGGMIGYDGHSLPDFPNLRAFDDSGTVAEILTQAMNVEKGADRLYSALVEHLAGDPVAPALEQLAKAERAHGRAVYNALKKLGEQHLDDFDALYDSLPGDILESGRSFDEAIQIAGAVAQHGTAALLELALETELRAYDLYRSLSHRAEQEELRATFIDLAEQEKRHARALLRELARGDSN